jgi:hypothetical protein
MSDANREAPMRESTTGDAVPRIEAPTTRDDALAEIDEITAALSKSERHEAEEHERVAAAHAEFSAEFTRRFESEARPAMDAILERLRTDGGGGVIVERVADPSRLFPHRFTLWMSLDGEIEGTPRQDRHPYLQLDADVSGARVGVFEGDLWRDRPGGSSGKVTDWTLEQMDAIHVEQEAIGILRRSTIDQERTDDE